MHIQFPKIRFADLSSAQILSGGYLTVILLGTLFLAMPFATVDGEGLGLVNALFTATSATCVTGLTVVTTQTTFTFLGKMVIMILIQIGGLGIMTMSTAFAMVMGKKITLRQRLMIQEDLKQLEISGLLRLIRYILAVTFVIEGIGAVILFFRLIQDFPVGKAVFYAVFHSISAFNNAGFDLFGNSLEGYVGDFTVNLTIIFLIILGGLGFAVLAELYDKRKTVTLHARMVLTTTGILLASGWVIFFLLEYANPATLGHLSFGKKLLASLFLSVTPRTAGFNTVATGALFPATLVLMMLFMFIGASPGSTGGGVKTTTITTLLSHLWSTIRGKDDVELFGRRLEEDTVVRAFTTLMISMMVIFLITFFLAVTEDLPFLSLFFETVSAFGTTGLSTGITGSLSTAGRILITLAMLCGRVGTLTLIMSMSEANRKKGQFHYPKEKIMVG